MPENTAAAVSPKSVAATPSADAQEASTVTSIPVQQLRAQPASAGVKPGTATPKPASSKLKSTVKIPGSLQSARQQAAQQPVQGQQVVKEEEEGHTYSSQLPDKAYTEEEFMAAWHAYGQQVKAAGRQGEYIVLKEAPELGENHHVRVRITNTFQQDFFEKAKPGALTYLRKALQNSQISMDCVIVKEEEGKRLYTAQEKFGYLLKKYPQLQDLKDRLGLEADF